MRPERRYWSDWTKGRSLIPSNVLWYFWEPIIVIGEREKKAQRMKTEDAVERHSRLWGAGPLQFTYWFFIAFSVVPIMPSAWWDWWDTFIKVAVRVYTESLLQAGWSNSPRALTNKCRNTALDQAGCNLVTIKNLLSDNEILQQMHAHIAAAVSLILFPRVHWLT